jgi:hypothetical protein
MPYKGGVQLLPETQRRPTLASYTSGNSFFYGAVVLGAVIVVVSAILGGYKANLRDKISALDGTMATSEKARNKDQEQQLLAASKQSSIIGDLLKSKLYWTQALARMEQMTQSSVSLTSLQADASHGTIAFRATTDSYASVARQIAAFVAATGIQDISVASIKTTPQGKVEFDGTLTIDAKALLNQQTSTQ